VKHIFALLVFILALMLQLWLAPAGMRGDFVLTTLIVFAFIFTFWELVVFALFGAFFLNTSPYLGWSVLMLILIPLLAYIARNRFPLDRWFGVLFGIVIGIPLFYAITAPVAALHAIGFLLVDILACVIFGELILYGMAG
jgi:hypothetical protein